MKILKRDGRYEQLSFDKVIYRLRKLCNDESLGVLSSIDPDIVAQRVVNSIYDGVSSSELDEEAARIAVSFTENPEYGKLASRIVVSNLHKSTHECFSEVMEILYNNKDSHDKHAPLIAEDVIEIVRQNKNRLNFVLDYKRDYMFDYFGFKTLERAYLMKTKSADKQKVIERPQHMYMRVALGIHKDDIENAIKTYDLISQGYYTHATPTMFNAGTPLSQLSSCYLVGTQDSVDGIFKTITDCARISKLAGGIGVHISNIRSKGSLIRGTNGQSDGIAPMLKVYNDTAVYINQCFTPDTWVYSKNGPKQIKDVTTFDQLVTIDGTFKKVNEVIKNNVSKEILEIRATNTLFPLKVTKEHEIYLIKGQKKITNFNLIKNRLEKKIVKPDFYNASEMTENDLVGYPIPSYIDDYQNEDLDFYKFYGLMLGDGYHRNNGYHEYGIHLSDTSKQEEQEFVKNYLTKYNVSYWTCDHPGCTKIGWYDKGKLGLTREMLYDEKNEKRIVDSLLHLPKTKTLKLIEGLLKSDGSNLKELYFHNTSQQLIMQLRYLFLRVGILTSGHVRDNIVKSHVTKHGRTITTRKVSYVLRIPKHPVLEEILTFKKKGQFLKYFEWNGMLWGRIKSISKINYTGDVYDFNMIDNHNYLTDMGLVHNSGKRKGSFAMYIEPWHADIFDFLEMRKNQGHEDLRARDLFYALWIPDLFMKQVKENGEWHLMCPDECPGLPDVYGKEFEYLYNKYVEEKRFKKVVKAQDLWTRILEAQIETGQPYMTYKDSVNEKSNQKNIGTIRSSNLCNEIVLYSDDKEYAVCNLESVALPMFVKRDENGKSSFDHQHLYEVTKSTILSMNRVIDNNYYPTEETRRSNFKHRPLGIGVQGLHDVYIMMKHPFESEDARQLNREIFETIYFACLEGSMELAKVDGPYETFQGSPMSQGLLQFDLWAQRENLDLSKYLSGRWDWDRLKDDIKKYGVRNSMLTCCQPTASTAQILGNTECIEPVDSCIFKRRVLSGEFTVINRHLVRDLQELGIWSKEMKDKIILNNGSIQTIEEIPKHIRELYKTVWEISQKALIDQSADRGLFIDQTQSLNLFVANPTFKKLTSMHFYAHSKGVKTGLYYLRSKGAATAAKFSVDANLEKQIREKQDKGAELTKEEETLLCSIDNKEACMMCQ